LMVIKNTDAMGKTGLPENKVPSRHHGYYCYFNSLRLPASWRESFLPFENWPL
jgi:hypothetical protein